MVLKAKLVMEFYMKELTLVGAWLFVTLIFLTEEIPSIKERIVSSNTPVTQDLDMAIELKLAGDSACNPQVKVCET